MDKSLKSFAAGYDDLLELGSALISEGLSIFETEAFKEGALIREVMISPMEDERGYNIAVIYDNQFETEEEE